MENVIDAARAKVANLASARQQLMKNIQTELDKAFPTYPPGIKTQVNSQLIKLGIKPRPR